MKLSKLKVLNKLPSGCDQEHEEVLAAEVTHPLFPLAREDADADGEVGDTPFGLDSTLAVTVNVIWHKATEVFVKSSRERSRPRGLDPSDHQDLEPMSPKLMSKSWDSIFGPTLRCSCISTSLISSCKAHSFRFNASSTNVQSRIHKRLISVALAATHISTCIRTKSIHNA